MSMYGKKTQYFFKEKNKEIKTQTQIMLTRLIVTFNTSFYFVLRCIINILHPAKFEKLIAKLS